MTALLQRPIPFDRHPITARDYRIPTPTIEKFYLLIQRALRFRIPGAIIYGRSRFGKSRAIDFLEELLRREDKTLPLLKLACQRKKAPSELGFFANLLTAAGHAAANGGTTTALRQRLTSRLREIAERYGSNRILLFAALWFALKNPPKPLSRRERYQLHEDFATALEQLLAHALGVANGMRWHGKYLFEPRILRPEILNSARNPTFGKRNL